MEMSTPLGEAVGTSVEKHVLQSLPWHVMSVGAKSRRMDCMGALGQRQEMKQL
jgi:hypothetical protein